MAKPKNKEADELLKSLQGSQNKQRRTWFNQLPQETQDALNDIKAMFNSGQYPGVAKTALHAACREKYNLTITSCTFSIWLAK